MQLGGPLPWAADRLPDRADAVDHVLQHLMVVDVGGGDVHVQRQPAPGAEGGDLVAGFAPVSRAGSGQVPLLSARTCMLSILARDQSICPATPRTSSVAWCRALITPTSTQSANRRCAVRQCTGNEPGSLRHEQPDSSTYRIAASIARSSVRRRPPPWCLSGCCGRNGWARCQNGSGQYFSPSSTPGQRMTLDFNNPKRHTVEGEGAHSSCWAAR